MNDDLFVYGRARLPDGTCVFQGPDGTMFVRDKRGEQHPLALGELELLRRAKLTSKVLPRS